MVPKGSARNEGRFRKTPTVDEDEDEDEDEDSYDMVEERIQCQEAFRRPT